MTFSMGQALGIVVISTWLFFIHLHSHADSELQAKAGIVMLSSVEP